MARSHRADPHALRRGRTPRLRTRGRWPSLVSTVVLVAGLAALVLSAIHAEGFPVRHVELNDGGIWVTSDKDGLFGRLNRPAASLDAVFYPPGGAHPTYALDVLQDGSAVVAWDRTEGKVFPVDVARGVTVGSQGLPVPAGYQAQLLGGTLAVLDPATGKVWATRVDQARSLTGFRGLDFEQPPLATADVGTPGEAGTIRSALAVGVDGTIHLASVTGHTTVVHPAGSGFGAAEAGELGWSPTEVAVTAVGDRMVVFDPASGRVAVPGAAPVTLAGVGTSAEATRPVLQRPSQPLPGAASVLIATSAGLVSVALDGGRMSTLFDAMTGTPTAPVRMGGCVHAAWAGTSGGYARGCDGGEVKKGDLEHAQVLQRPVFRANRGVVVLNDLRNGATWDLIDQQRMDNWALVKPPPVADPSKEKRTDPDRQVLRDQPPKAVDDVLGARPGRTTLLHVLDNDSDPAGSILSISAVSATDVATAKVSISPDGQTVAITVTEPGGPVHFTYTVDDGRNSKQAAVTVKVRTADENETPKLRPQFVAPRWSVPSGGRLAMPLLADWRDFDGDPMVLTDAKATRGSVTTRTNGFLDYLAPPAGGTYRVSYGVSDGMGTPTPANIDVTVLAPTATTTVAPTALPDVARGQVGQPIVIRPLENDVPGADPSAPAAKLALAGDVGGQADAIVVTNLATGTVVVTATKPGPYQLTYRAAFGNAPFSDNGMIRVDVLPVPKSPAAPVAMPDTSVLHGQLPATVDVLANDFDQAGGVLAVLHAAPAPKGPKLQVTVIEGQWLRISALEAARTSTRQVVRYTVDNGLTAPVTGEVSVTLLPDAADTTPVPADDVATVRSGDTVTVAVLDNDTNAGGAPMMLAANVLDAPAPGQLVARAPGAQDPGAAYVTGNLVRYTAPAVTIAQPVTVDYVVQNAAGDTAVGHLKITVTPPPGDKFANRPPAPVPVEARAVAGQTVTITIPTTGVDIDGDPVAVSGIATAPTQGRIIAANATSIAYQAFPTSAGTDSFSYLVTDRFGAVGRAGIRVGITPPGSPQPPVAVDDLVTAAPGAQLQLDVLANDLHAPGDALTILPLADRNPQLPPGAKLSGPRGPIEVTAPDEPGKAVVVVYAITDGIGEPSVATVTVRSQDDYNNPPIAYDAYADPAPGATEVEVDVLGRCADIDGDLADLVVTRVFEPNATFLGGRVKLQVTGVPRTVGYEVRDADGATAVGLIHVSTPGSGLPYAKPGASITIGKNTSAKIDISEYVVSPSGKPVRLTTTDRIWASPPKGLVAANDGQTGLQLTSAGDYIGPAALSFEVTDGQTLSDPQARTAVVSIPVQVGPDTPVLHCPLEPIEVIEGGPVVTIDVTTVCHTWTADPNRLPELRYTASWNQRADGIELGDSGGRAITLSADTGTVPGTTGSITVGVDGTEAVPATLHVKVIPAAPASFSPAEIPAVKAGDTATVEVTGYVRSVLRQPAVSVVAVEQTKGMAAKASFDGAKVVITPAAESHGDMVFAVTVTDVADTGRGDRHVTGQVVAHVLGVPDAPGTPSSGAEVLSHSVQLSWDKPANNGAPIDYYEVAWSGGTQQCAASPCLITGLANNVGYAFTVKAHNVVGWSKPSARSAEIRPDAAPGAVTGLSASNPQDHTLTLTWQPATTDGSRVKRYDITWSGGGRGSATGTTFNPPGLDNDLQYTFTVIAVNDKGPGPGTQVRGQSAGAPAAPSAPDFASLTSADRTTRAVTVSWNAVGPNGPGPTTYTLVRRGSGTVTVCADVTTTSCPDDGIPNDGTIYTYTVVAANAAAAGGPGHTSPPSAGASMEATATPDPITDYTIAATGTDGQAQLSFDVPASHGASSTVTCTWSGGNCGSWSYPVGGQSGVVRTVGGLNNGQNTTVSLQVCNGSSGGAGAGTPCNTAVGRNVTTYGNMNSLTINTSVNGTVVNFTVAVNPNGKPATVRVQSRVRDTTFTTGVGAGSWSYSDDVGYSTTDNITVTVSDSGRPTLTQSASATTPPPPPTVGVSVGAACGPSTGTACAGTGTCSGTCYYITVTTANFSGNQTCTFNSSLGSDGFVTMSIGPNQTKQSGNWFGGHGGWATATCGGVTGRRDNWP
ncbi:fibronectin type III [Catellatospora methionotrophica]|uniref:Fibronectin type III n=1 Tax=Catellatospora methionotrophica TaxID=121620 RepID=A0A8J3LQU4_9ACTN|nr:Ig-like domain-containing protein [Catellatospora methionotrophica]GIG17160.1 fibronectin type III [Catellatospora methionotrophica]